MGNLGRLELRFDNRGRREWTERKLKFDAANRKKTEFGVVSRVYGNRTYDVMVAGRAYPYTEVGCSTAMPNFKVGDGVTLGFDYDEGGLPIIISPGHLEFWGGLPGGVVFPGESDWYQCSGLYGNSYGLTVASELPKFQAFGSITNLFAWDSSFNVFHQNTSPLGTDELGLVAFKPDTGIDLFAAMVVLWGDVTGSPAIHAVSTDLIIREFVLPDQSQPIFTAGDYTGNYSLGSILLAPEVQTTNQLPGQRNNREGRFFLTVTRSPRGLYVVTLQSGVYQLNPADGSTCAQAYPTDDSEQSRGTWRGGCHSLYDIYLVDGAHQGYNSGAVTVTESGQTINYSANNGQIWLATKDPTSALASAYVWTAINLKPLIPSLYRSAPCGIPNAYDSPVANGRFPWLIDLFTDPKKPRIHLHLAFSGVDTSANAHLVVAALDAPAQALIKLDDLVAPRLSFKEIAAGLLGTATAWLASEAATSLINLARAGDLPSCGAPDGRGSDPGGSFVDARDSHGDFLVTSHGNKIPCNATFSNSNTVTDNSLLHGGDHSFDVITQTNEAEAYSRGFDFTGVTIHPAQTPALVRPPLLHPVATSDDGNGIDSFTLDGRSLWSPAGHVDGQRNSYRIFSVSDFLTVGAAYIEKKHNDGTPITRLYDSSSDTTIQDSGIPLVQTQTVTTVRTYDMATEIELAWSTWLHCLDSKGRRKYNVDISDRFSWPKAGSFPFGALGQDPGATNYPYWFNRWAYATAGRYLFVIQNRIWYRDLAPGTLGPQMLDSRADLFKVEPYLVVYNLEDGTLSGRANLRPPGTPHELTPLTPSTPGAYVLARPPVSTAWYPPRMRVGFNSAGDSWASISLPWWGPNGDSPSLHHSITGIIWGQIKDSKGRPLFGPKGNPLFGVTVRDDNLFQGDGSKPLYLPGPSEWATSVIRPAADGVALIDYGNNPVTYKNAP